MSSSYNDKAQKHRRFPALLLSISMLLTFVAIVLLSFNNLQISKKLQTTISSQIRAMELHGFIMQFDEALTMSTMLGIVTDDQIWEQRYNSIKPDLFNALNEATQISHHHEQELAIKTIEDANKKLMEMEQQAFNLTKKGKQNEAKELIFGPEYHDQKLIYKDSMEAYAALIEKHTDRELHAQTNHARKIFLMVIIYSIFLFLTWMVTLRNINRWKAELGKTSASEKQYKNEIVTAHNLLNEMLMINKMNDQLQACNDLQSAYPIIAQAAGSLFTGLSGALSMHHHNSKEFHTTQDWGDCRIAKPTFTLDDCWALREAHVYLVNNPNEGLICRHFKSTPPSGYLCLPLITQNTPFGALELNASAGEKITDYQQQLALMFSEALRLSLSNIMLRETLNKQAIQDTLTGLFNRRYLNENLPRELQRALRKNIFLSVAMLDVDHFKEINDTYGHRAGDEVLKYIGALLKYRFRGSDIACRYGGEEFTLIFFDSKLTEAIPRLEQICKEVKDTHLFFQNQPLPQITVSIGVAEAPTHATTADEIVRMADEALYIAKQTGRDKIVKRGQV